MSRSTLDLIEELYARASELWTFALVVGCEDHSEFVFANQAQGKALEAINSHIVRGGEPIGFIGMPQPNAGGARRRFSRAGF
jgi:hypothetical protein